MREIKFRAWDKQEGQWLQGSTAEIVAHGGNTERFILMQYTGLKDAKGREVYEGDIFCYTDDIVQEYIGGYSRTEPEGIIGEVRFEKGAYWFNDELLEELAPYAEVIGNIYENPDLIKN